MRMEPSCQWTNTSTKAGGTLYRSSAEFLEMSDGQIRIVGRLVEKITPEQFHF
jgi:hypothetical protein